MIDFILLIEGEPRLFWYRRFIFKLEALEVYSSALTKEELPVSPVANYYIQDNNLFVSKVHTVTYPKKPEPQHYVVPLHSGLLSALHELYQRYHENMCFLATGEVYSNGTLLGVFMHNGVLLSEFPTPMFFTDVYPDSFEFVCTPSMMASNIMQLFNAHYLLQSTEYANRVQLPDELLPFYEKVLSQAATPIRSKLTPLAILTSAATHYLLYYLIRLGMERYGIHSEDWEALINGD